MDLTVAVPAIQLHDGPQQCHQPATTAGDGQASSDATPGRTVNTRIIQLPSSPVPFSEMGSGSGIPQATYSELAATLLSSGRCDQALDISSEAMSISEGVRDWIPLRIRQETKYDPAPKISRLRGQR